MKLNISLVVLALYTASSAAILGFGKSAYNRWHETELERWLADHDIPYPTPADRKDLEALMKENWDRMVNTPYANWDTDRLQAYLTQKGVQIEEKGKDNKNWLIETVKKNWYGAGEAIEDGYGSVRDWIFDSWSDSQLKAFLDRHGIPNPSPRKRDTMLAAARENYQTIADKVGETAAYPGNWLYESWSDSELKKWLDEHGIPAPQPTTRDKLIARVRRHSHLAALKLRDYQAAASASAEAARESAANAVFESWSDSQLKQWADKNGINVPQGSTRNELLALARRNMALLKDDTVSASMSAAYSSATSSASSLYGRASGSASSAYSQATDTVGSAYSQATDTITSYTQAAFDEAIKAWSDSRLKEYLDSRGMPVPQNTKRDELLAQVRLQRHKAASGHGAWTFDTWTTDNLRKYLESQGNKLGTSAKASREQLVDAAKKAYASASATGGSAYASVTSAMAKATDAVKDTAFDTWSDSDLKAYLDSYGVKTYQGSTRNELLREARRVRHMFLYGTAGPRKTMYDKLTGAIGWIYQQVMRGVGLAGKKAEKVEDRAKEGATYMYDRAYEEGQKGYDRAKEDL